MVRFYFIVTEYGILQNKENDYNPPCNKIDPRLMYGMAFYYSQINGECIFETKSLGTCLIRE